MSLRPVAGITDERELTPEMVAARRAGAATRRVGAARDEVTAEAHAVFVLPRGSAAP